MSAGYESVLSGKEEKKLQRRARNMASYAMRMAHRGYLGKEIEPKSLSRFLPFVEVSVEPEVYDRANELLVDGGLQVKRLIKNTHRTVSENTTTYAIGPVMGVRDNGGPYHTIETGEYERMVVSEVAQPNPDSLAT